MVLLEDPLHSHPGATGTMLGMLWGASLVLVLKAMGRGFSGQHRECVREREDPDREVVLDDDRTGVASLLHLSCDLRDGGGGRADARSAGGEIDRLAFGTSPRDRERQIEVVSVDHANELVAMED